ncbi:ABC transporter substrate-binding protein [soil metagenome]
MDGAVSNRLALSRRAVLGGSAAAAIASMMPGLLGHRASAQGATPVADLVDEITIDLEVEPPTLDPALGEDINAWSIVHSLYDSVVNLSPSGEAVPLLATSVDFPDPLTCRIVLPTGRTFHDGSPVDSTSVQRALDHIRDPKTASQIVDNFAPIETVTIVDAQTIEFGLSAPAPSLLAKFAPWLTPLSESGLAAIGQAPIGSVPYKFVSWTPGESIVLEADPAYPADSPKGQPIAKKVTFRFVPEPTTRVADLLSGSATIVRSIPPDQTAAVTDGGAQVVTQPVTGISIIRVANDVAPFTDARVRQALNHAVDVDSIISALLGGNGLPLATLFPEGGLGFDPDLVPLGYDPELAKSLLADAGVGDGFDVDLEHTADGDTTVLEAIVSMLGEVGINVTLVPVETASFNATWKEGAPLRYLTWRPVNDPYTLLSLVFSNQGYLSRYSSDAAQALIDSAAVETDPAARSDQYRQLGTVFQQDPPAIFLTSLVSLYGVAADAPAWTPRNDDYTIPTLVG